MAKIENINSEEANDVFLCERLKQLRIANKRSMEEMARLLGFSNKSNISRVESGKMSKSKLLEYVDLYCKALKLSEEQKNLLLRGEKIAITDKSVLFARPRIVDELNEEYNKVIIPDFVVDELDRLNSRDPKLSKKAWQIKSSITWGKKTICMKYEGKEDELDNQMVGIAKQALDEYGCEIHIYTDNLKNTQYTKIKGNEKIKVYDLSDYTATKQNLLNINQLNEINEYYGEDFEKFGKIDSNLADAYLPNGQTLIISAVLSGKPDDIVKKKIKWLISNGADVNKRGNYDNYFPAITFAIKKNKLELFKFLLNECNANPNAGSRNPSGKGNFLNANDGNMPLMVAAFHGRTEFVRILCNNPNISINQQDANGFTALIKASRNGYFDCRNILLDAGADERIVDRDGHNAQYWLNYYNENGSNSQMHKKFNSKNKKN